MINVIISPHFYLWRESGLWGQVLTWRHYPSLPWGRGLKEHAAGRFRGLTLKSSRVKFP